MRPRWLLARWACERGMDGLFRLDFTIVERLRAAGAVLAAMFLVSTGGAAVFHGSKAVVMALAFA